MNRQLINSIEYHNKFKQLDGISHTVQESLYKQAGRLLKHVDGKNEEHMIAVNAKTGELIVDNLARQGKSHKTGFTDDEYQKIIDCKNQIILMHNHPDTMHNRPSATDILTFLKHDFIKISMIIGHEEEIYAIYNVHKQCKEVFNDYYERAKTQTNNNREAIRLATTNMYIFNQKTEIFDVRRLGNNEYK